MSKALHLEKNHTQHVWLRRILQPQKLRIILTTALLIIIALLWIYPLVWMISASLKEPMEIFTEGLNLIPQQWRWDNYVRAWQDAGFGQYLFNTIFVTVGTTALALFQCSLSGYVIGRYRFIGKRMIAGILIATLFVPTGYTIIPQIQLAAELGLLNSLWGMVVVMGAGHSTSILLFAGYFSRLPRELEEAAVIDGAGFLTIFWRVMLPLARPAIATVTLLTFLNAWNNFFVPLVFTFSQPELRTLSVGMLSFVGQHETDWSGMAAGATIALLPIMTLFLFLQRYYVEGLAGAVKN